MLYFHEKLECPDIEVLVDYSQESTTHVVAGEFNTSECLQGLINGKYIVDYTFIDAIATATASEENDWPDELQYLAPQGAGPTKRSSNAYAPDSKRQTIFEGYTFIFYDKFQFENLRVAIEDGHGKALLRQINPSTAKVEDFIQYIKGLDRFEDGKGLVVRAEKPIFDLYSEFARHLSLSLRRRLVEQDDFLDVILNSDVSSLYKPLETEINMPTPEIMPAGQVWVQAPASKSYTLSTSSSHSMNRARNRIGVAKSGILRKKLSKWQWKLNTRKFGGMMYE